MMDTTQIESEIINKIVDAFNVVGQTLTAEQATDAWDAPNGPDAISPKYKNWIIITSFTINFNIY